MAISTPAAPISAQAAKGLYAQVSAVVTADSPIGLAIAGHGKAELADVKAPGPIKVAGWTQERRGLSLARPKSRNGTTWWGCCCSLRSRPPNHVVRGGTASPLRQLQSAESVSLRCAGWPVVAGTAAVGARALGVTSPTHWQRPTTHSRLNIQSTTGLASGGTRRDVWIVRDRPPDPSRSPHICR